jgi:predicted DNA-binding transcriptional regulator YafY
MTHTAARLLTLIQLLQRRPGQKAAELAGILGVSVRTLHRYLAMLDEMGLPLYSERGPSGGFSLVRGYRLPPLIFTPPEAAVLALGVRLVSELWGPLYPDAAAGALVKLEAVLPDDQRTEVDWARRILVTSGLHRPDLEAAARWLEPLRRAAREQRQAWLRYRGGGRAAVEERLFDAYALVLRSGWWYVAGYCHLRRELRTFRLDRIEALELRGEHFEVPAGFDVQAYLADELRARPGITAHLRFEPQVAEAARSSRLVWDALEEEPGGGVRVTLRAPDLTWAASTVISYGPRVSVLDPPSLRRLVGEWARELAEKYQKDILDKELEP